MAHIYYFQGLENVYWVASKECEKIRIAFILSMSKWPSFFLCWSKNFKICNFIYYIFNKLINNTEQF